MPSMSMLLSLGKRSPAARVPIRARAAILDLASSETRQLHSHLSQRQLLPRRCSGSSCQQLNAGWVGTNPSVKGEGRLRWGPRGTPCVQALRGSPLPCGLLAPPGGITGDWSWFHLNSRILNLISQSPGGRSRPTINFQGSDAP